MSEDIDKILKDIEAEKLVKQQAEEEAGQQLKVDDETAERLSLERRSIVSGFKLDLDLEEVGEEKEKADTGGKKPKKSRGCLRGVIYAFLVLASSGVLAYYAVVGGLDMTGLFKSDTKVPVTLTAQQIKDIGEVSRALKKAGVIDQPLIFNLFCRLTGAADDFKPQDEASISPDMGYRAIINILRTMDREIVRVTFPEGMTVSEIAKKLEESKVCSVSDFYIAMDSDKFTHSFISEIPDGEEYKGRFEKFEGYIFPDSYDFYVGSSGEAALRKFFDAFNARVDTTMRAQIKAKDMTLNEIIILASIIQWEAAKPEDMYKVSRVIHNRLENTDKFPKLQCDSTQRYIDSITPPVGGKRIVNLDYDTYKKKGLPIGAINNPGLDAIDAAINPSNDSSVKGRFYFATDMKTGVTKFSKTLYEHEAWCREHKVGMYA